MARKPVRTDYVYNVTSDDSWTHTRPAHRTLRGAVAVASEGLWYPKIVKTGPNTWDVKSTLDRSPCVSTITRSPLVN